MTSHGLRLVSGVIVVVATAALPMPVAGQAPTTATNSLASSLRTTWGDPDIQGTWTSDNSINVPLERPVQFGERRFLTEEEYANRVQENDKWIADANAERPVVPFAKDPAANNAPRHWLERGQTPSRQTSLVVDPPDGRIPMMTQQGQQRLAARQALRRSRGPADSYEDRSNYDRCITRGVAGSILPVIYGNGTDIRQVPGYVVIRNEMIHEARVIPLDGRPHAGADIRLYMGDSRGRFEGDTLVIETRNFTDRTAIGPNGNGAIHSETLRLVERFTRVDDDTLHYEFTVDDPVVYTLPWTVALDLTTTPNYEIYEYACHEGNYGLANILSAARAEEKAAQRP
jgi:hypothetical protein